MSNVYNDLMNFRRILKFCYRKIPAIVLLLISISASAQSGNETSGGVRVTTKAGVSVLMTELYRDLSGSVNEFSNFPGPAFGMEMSMFVTPALEAGAGISFYTLNGRAEVPDFTAIGHQYHMEEPPSGAVQYNNRLWGPELFARYHFGRKKLLPLSVHLEAGVGAITHHSALYYADRKEEEVLFGKGRGSFSGFKVTNMLFTFGGGLNYQVSQLVGVNLSAGLNAVDYDLLDVVHNFDASGDRRRVIGLFSSLTTGLTFTIPGKKKYQPVNSIPGSHLPFSPAVH